MICLECGLFVVLGGTFGPLVNSLSCRCATPTEEAGRCRACGQSPGAGQTHECTVTIKTTITINRTGQP